MKYPHIQSAIPKEHYTLFIKFDNREERVYDVSPLLTKKMFSPLKNKALFKKVKVDKGGYAVYWNKDIDISEYELWKNGFRTTAKKSSEIKI